MLPSGGPPCNCRNTRFQFPKRLFLLRHWRLSFHMHSSSSQLILSSVIVLVEILSAIYFSCGALTARSAFVCATVVSFKQAYSMPSSQILWLLNLIENYIYALFYTFQYMHVFFSSGTDRSSKISKVRKRIGEQTRNWTESSKRLWVFNILLEIN